MFTQPIEKHPISNLPLLTAGQLAFLGIARLQANTYGAMVSCQMEALNFLQNRLEQDLKFISDLMGNSEFNDAFDVTAQFVQRVAQDYTAEAGTLATIGSKLNSQTARLMRKQADKLVDDLAVRTVA